MVKTDPVTLTAKERTGGIEGSVHIGSATVFAEKRCDPSAAVRHGGVLKKLQHGLYSINNFRSIFSITVGADFFCKFLC